MNILSILWSIFLVLTSALAFLFAMGQLGTNREKNIRTQNLAQKAYDDAKEAREKFDEAKEKRFAEIRQLTIDSPLVAIAQKNAIREEIMTLNEQSAKLKEAETKLLTESFGKETGCLAGAVFGFINQSTLLFLILYAIFAHIGPAKFSYVALCLFIIKVFYLFNRTQSQLTEEKMAKNVGSVYLPADKPFINRLILFVPDLFFLYFIVMIFSTTNAPR